MAAFSMLIATVLMWAGILEAMFGSKRRAALCVCAMVAVVVVDLALLT